MTAQAGDTLHHSHAAQKKALRRSLRQLRSAIAPARRRSLARRAARHLLRARALRRARHIAVYLSARSELSTVFLIEQLLRQRRRLWAPVTARGAMRFAPLRRGTTLRRSALGLYQPAQARPLRSARRMDLIVLPLLGFDAAGGRLGNGGGYYDRALAGTRPSARPLLLGYAYAAQQVAAVPLEAWDMRLDAVITEHGWRRLR